ncbi:MAG: hypothetical protein GXP29_07755 [Planctomycetes bacterium]|nr:hypothetical protein [Planctomycetota bacterium]
MKNRISRLRPSQFVRTHCLKLARVFPIGIILLGTLASFGPVYAHPHGPFELVTHQHPALGLIISIEDDRVVYDVSLSNGFLNTLVPRERGFLKLRLEENTFVFLDPAQEEQERKYLATFFSQLDPITVDGATVTPEFDRFTFVRSSASADIAVSETLPPDARIRIQYPTTTAPKSVELVWRVFSNAYSVDAFGNPSEPKLSARLDTRSRSRIITFSEESPTVSWNAPSGPVDKSIFAVSFDAAEQSWTIPVLSIGVLVAGFSGWHLSRRTPRTRRVGAPLVVAALVVAVLGRNVGGISLNRGETPDSARAIEQIASPTFEALLRNIYRAFDYRSESDVYDILAQSVDGPLLDEVYKEIHRTLIAAEQGNAVAKVKSVEMLGTTLIEPFEREDNGFEIKGQWRVDGMVYHWGHVHDTSRIFEANYTIAPREGFWKIIKTELMKADPDA